MDYVATVFFTLTKLTANWGRGVPVQYICGGEFGYNTVLGWAGFCFEGVELGNILYRLWHRQGLHENKKVFFPKKIREREREKGI